MPHNNYVRPDGQWPPEFVLTPGDLRRFDVYQFQALNGDAGGTWVPLTPITIGGQSLVLTGSSSLGHTLSGGVATWSGGRVYLGASIYPSFGTPPSRTIQFPLRAQGFASQSPVGSAFNQVGVTSLGFRIPPRQLHNGATLASANVTFQVSQKHIKTPTTLPQAMLVRDDYLPFSPQPWASGTVAGGTLIRGTDARWPYAYVAVGSGGTTAGSEPNWSSAETILATKTDGSVTWVAIGYSPTAPNWQANQTYAIGAVVQPVPGNGLVYVATAGLGTLTSGATQPSFPFAIGATVVDNPGANQVIWTCVGTPRAAYWLASQTYGQGCLVTAFPDNGMYYRMTTSGGGTSGGTHPTWNAAVGSSTTDGSCVWLCLGSNPIGAGSLPTPATPEAYLDGGAPQVMSVPCHGATTIDTENHSYCLVVTDERGVGAFQSVEAGLWTATTGYVSSVNYFDSSFVTPNPANGFYYVYAAAGNLSEIGVSGSSPPPWPPLVGGFTTIDGTIAGWQCAGPTTPSMNVALSAALAFTNIADMRPE